MLLTLWENINFELIEKEIYFTENVVIIGIVVLLL